MVGSKSSEEALPWPPYPVKQVLNAYSQSYYKPHLTLHNLSDTQVQIQ